MTASHPPSLVTLVTRTMTEECKIARGDQLLLGVSGGPDSMALLHVLARLRWRLGFVLSAHGVDHGLRPAATTELGLAEAFARELEVPFSRSQHCLEPGGNLQARARKVRYRALRERAAQLGARFLVTAHHAQDRAETVLLRLLRGAGVRGLGVLPARQDDLLRPMIRALPGDVNNHLTRHRIPHAHDPSNQDERFGRVRVRQELMPVLVALSPQIVKHLTDLADQVIVGEPPQVLDAAGAQVPLGRAQASQLARILASQNFRGSVNLGDGQLVRLDPATGRPKLVACSEVAGPNPHRKND